MPYSNGSPIDTVDQRKGDLRVQLDFPVPLFYIYCYCLYFFCSLLVCFFKQIFERESNLRVHSSSVWTVEAMAGQNTKWRNDERDRLNEKDVVSSDGVLACPTFWWLPCSIDNFGNENVHARDETSPSRTGLHRHALYDSAASAAPWSMPSYEIIQQSSSRLH